MKRLSILALSLFLSSCALRSPITGRAPRDVLSDTALTAMSYIIFGQNLEDIPKDELQGYLIRFGLAFGPANVRHFSELDEMEQAALLARVPVLAETHTDWPKPLQWVPRTWTVWVGPPPKPTDVLRGHVSPETIKPDGTLLPIPVCGDDYVVRGYLAQTTRLAPIQNGCLHHRIGWRYDDVDGYYTLTFTIKRIP